MVINVVLLVPLLFCGCILAEKCFTPNKEEAECIALYSCGKLLSALGTQNPVSLKFVEQSNCGGTPSSPWVCCGPSSNFTQVSEPKPDEKMSLLPSKQICGLQHSDDYFRGATDNSVRITEFPWLAAIIYKMKKGASQKEPTCGGSLINRRYILTAAHCIQNSVADPVAVHLGEYDITGEKDCVQEEQFGEECSEPLQIFGVEKAVVHPGYDGQGFIDDIGLIRLNNTVQYNDYVRPICLPFPGTTLAQPGDVLRTSGWGRTHSSAHSAVKKRVLNLLIANEDCQKFYDRRTPKNITAAHLCTTPKLNSSDFLCRGDNGGPLIFSKRAQWHQEGVSSFGSATCDDNSPFVYARVANYLDWLLENVEK